MLNDSLRFPDEFVRHKILDLVGDLLLLGRPLRAHVVGRNAGHALNHQLVCAIQQGGRRRPASLGRRGSSGRPLPLPVAEPPATASSRVWPPSRPATRVAPPFPGFPLPARPRPARTACPPPDPTL